MKISASIPTNLPVGIDGAAGPRQKARSAVQFYTLASRSTQKLVGDRGWRRSPERWAADADQHGLGGQFSQGLPYCTVGSDERWYRVIGSDYCTD